MIRKRIYAFCAAAGLLFGSLGGFSAWGETTLSDSVSAVENAAGSSFTDVPTDSWYYPYVAVLAGEGIIQGRTETTFDPQGTFTVAEAAAVITRYLGLEQQAADRKYAMEVLQVNGCDKWYAGYLQLKYEAGIIDVTNYGCAVLGRHISIETTELLEAPIKRYEFAAFITRSFELDGTEIRTHNGTFGHEFIYGGAYDESLLEAYIPYINDYALIPTGYNYYVLKAYYNGIFNGDDLGNFNPLNNLTRAEMAKVTAVIRDSSLRIRIDVSENANAQTLPAESFLWKNGEAFLKPEVSDKIVAEEAAAIVTFYENNMPYVSYTPRNTAPAGYAIGFYHFTKDKSGFDINLASERGKTAVYKNLFSPGDRVLLTFVNSATGEALDAVMLTLQGVNAVLTDDCRYLP